MQIDDFDLGGIEETYTEYELEAYANRFAHDEDEYMSETDMFDEIYEDVIENESGFVDDEY